MLGQVEYTMGHMENDIVEMIVKFIQKSEENLPKGDDVAQGTQEDKDSAHVDQASINKPSPSGFDSNNRINQGWSPPGIQLHKINMRKFDGKDPITWIFQME